jgi:hypothetical protein
LDKEFAKKKLRIRKGLRNFYHAFSCGSLLETNTFYKGVAAINGGNSYTMALAAIFSNVVVIT